MLVHRSDRCDRHAALTKGEVKVIKTSIINPTKRRVFAGRQGKNGYGG